MACTLLVEQIENRWIAHVREYPGCFSSGDSSIDAVIGSAPAIAAWLEVLVPLGLAVPGNTGPLASTVSELVPAWNASPDYEVNAFFAADRPPLTAEEIDRSLRILEHTRKELLAAVQGLTPAQLDAPVEGDWSIHRILKHTARAEDWYLDRLDLALSGEIPEDVFEHLSRVRDHLRKVVPALAGDERLAVKNYETWSPRKLLRRALWHERDHTQHIHQFRSKLGV